MYLKSLEYLKSKVPMTNDSTTITRSAMEIHEKKMKSPRISTLNFIRQFSRAYVALGGIATVNGLICN